MAKIRIYELARELDLESKEVLERAAELGFEVKTASSSLEDSDADVLRLKLAEADGGSAASPAATAERETAPELVEESPPEPAQPAESQSAESQPAESPPEPAQPESAQPAESPPEPAQPESAQPAESQPPAPAAEQDVDIVSIPAGASVADFAAAIGQGAGAIVKELLTRGQPVGANAPMPPELIEEIAEQHGYIVDVASEPEVAAATPRPRVEYDDADADLVPRPPVVTVMGHVDHGKTTLLDTIRRTKVVEGEQGGITQHVGAYQVEVNGNLITFIDTPGHAAFSAMRARGAEVTDIVVLVVAADDGVMPQTVEAISHAKAAGVELVVAVNKVDLPGADPFRVQTMLTEHDVITEPLGGDVPSVQVSALTGEGVDNLLEVIDLIAQLQEFTANPKPAAEGVVVESQLDAGMGPTATVIVQRGTLHQGDSFVAGPISGRVRAMMDHEGERRKSAGPSTPVLIMGWSDVPTAGDHFRVVANDKEARAIAAGRAETIKVEEQAAPSGRERLQTLLEQLRSEETELRVIIKADAHGSLEALRDAVVKITRDEARIDVTHSAVGGITENDVTLAEVTGSIVVGFNVRPDGKARRIAEQQGIEIRTYGIIYELLEELEEMLVGRLAPDTEEVVLGTAEVRATFKVPRAGTIAGCYVTEGVVQRGAQARLLRDGIVIHTGRIGSLRRFKDDVREVATGFECGIGLEDYNDVKDGDVIEAFTTREIPRT